jgi:glucosyl-3-phosphoglycerate synthase
LNAKINTWLYRNTFHSDSFSDLDRLVSLKREKGLTISLGLPALNEEATVGNVICTLKKALMEEVPLLDEIVLIDSRSTDRTREIATEMGVPVFVHQDVMPECGSYEGKGEALWKSLYLMDGDIVAWVDTDIRNIHPRFVYGVVGPLLMEDSLHYVKGFYRRPIKEGEKLLAGGGGRVTELTARPLINLFFPELSGLIQPLSGEYAGRRKVLEQVPFFTGYSVETGLLIDILKNFGYECIGQSDLLERIHHNQPLPSLSKMSFGIIGAVIDRLEKYHMVQIHKIPNETMKLVTYEGANFYLDNVEIEEACRLPMHMIPEYREKFSLDEHNAGDATT